MIRKALILLYLLHLFAPLPSLAQGTLAQMSPANDTGVRPYTSYVAARENINLANGNVNLVIPLLNLPGRNGLNLNLAIQYDSKIWKLQTNYDPVANTMSGTWTNSDFDSPHGQFGSGWRLNIPYSNF